MESTEVRHHDALNKGKLVGQKAPERPSAIGHADDRLCAYRTERDRFLAYYLRRCVGVI